MFPTAVGAYGRTKPPGPSGNPRLTNVTGDGTTFVPFFDEIVCSSVFPAGCGFEVVDGEYTGRFRCAEDGIYVVTGSLNFGNLTCQHQGIAAWMQNRKYEPFVMTGCAAAARCQTPPPGGGADLISIPVSWVGPVVIEDNPWINVVVRIAGGTKQVSFVYDSFLSVFKIAELP